VLSTNRAVSWIYVALAAACFALALATTAQADPSMFQASLIIEAFGNDTSTGYSSPFSRKVFTGIPFGRRCNTHTFHAQSTLTFTDWDPDRTIIIPSYGGQVAVITKFGGPPNPPTTPATRAAGCSETAIQAGAPLMGTGSAVTTGTTSARTFMLLQSTIAKVTSGSFYYYFPYMFQLTYADLRNQTGSFFKSGGPGNFTIEWKQGGNPAGKVVNKAGSNQFGGVMPLLGQFYSIRGYQQPTYLSVDTRTRLLHHLGATPATYLGAVTGGYSATAMNTHYTTGMGSRTTTTVAVSAFPWTTGTVTVTGLRGPRPSVLQRKGYDHRTSMGAGTIQMVSPMLTRWTGFDSQYETGAIGILRIVFTPEPTGWLLLAAGLGLLVVLHRVSRRGREAESLGSRS
jgi:hypothetical protein